jgi:hypothetical protein
MMLNRPWPFIFIGRGGIAPLGVETITKSCRNTTPNRFWQDGAVAFGTRSNRLCDVQIFQKLYLLHPDSELDVLYMDLDVLGESYPMVESKLPFEYFDQGSLTDLPRPTNFGCQHMPPVLWQSLHTRKHSQRSKLA